MEDQNPPITEPQSPTPIVTPTEPPKKPYGRNWKKWILIYIAIAAVLYGGIYYFVLAKQSSNPYSQPVTKTAPTSSPSTSPDPTADWKTYTNKTDKFFIKYPPDWRLRIDNPAANQVILESPDYTGNDSKGIIMNVRTSDTDKVDIEDWFADRLAESKKPLTKEDVMGKERIYEDSVKRTTISDIAAIQFISALQAGGLETAFIKNKKLFSIGILLFGKEQMDEKKKIYEQIVSTFKFTEQATEITGTPPNTSSQNEQDATMVHCGGAKTQIAEYYCPKGFTCKYQYAYANNKGTCIKE